MLGGVAEPSPAFDLLCNIGFLGRNPNLGFMFQNQDTPSHVLPLVPIVLTRLSKMLFPQAPFIQFSLSRFGNWSQSPRLTWTSWRLRGN